MSRRAISTGVRVTILAMLIVGMAILARTTPLGEALASFARALGELADRPWAPFAFIALYALAITFGLPGTLLTLIGGAAFGLGRGFAINLTGAIIGSAGAFLLARTVGREPIRRLFHNHLARLDGLEDPRTAFWSILRLRLMPIVPFNAVNFAAGLTKVSFGAFVPGTALGILPSTFLFTYFATALVNGGDERAGALIPLSICLAALLLLSLVPTIVRRVGKWRA